MDIDRESYGVLVSTRANFDYIHPVMIIPRNSIRILGAGIWRYLLGAEFKLKSVVSLMGPQLKAQVKLILQCILRAFQPKNQNSTMGKQHKAFEFIFGLAVRISRFLACVKKGSWLQEKKGAHP